MFDNYKFVTRGINDNLPQETTLFLWQLIDLARNKTELDYLQVFKLYPAEKDGIKMQKVIHTQEKPNYENEAYLVCDEPIYDKIFCIDDGSHSTMLFANEY